MNREEAIEMVRATMVELFDLAPAQIDSDKRLVEDLGLDSIDAIDMAGRIHEVTGKRVDDKELRSIRTVDDVVGLVVSMSGD